MLGTIVRPLELQFMLTMSMPSGLVILKRVRKGYLCDIHHDGDIPCITGISAPQLARMQRTPQIGVRHGAQEHGCGPTLKRQTIVRKPFLTIVIFDLYLYDEV